MMLPDPWMEMDPKLHKLMTTNWAARSFYWGVANVAFCSVWAAWGAWWADFEWWVRGCYVAIMVTLALFALTRLPESRRRMREFRGRRDAFLLKRAMFGVLMGQRGVPPEVVRYIDHLAYMGQWEEARALIEHALNLSREEKPPPAG